MKYIANPVEADAFKIDKIIAGTDESPMILHLEGGKLVSPNAGMLARMTPQVGDYWVIQADGYIYLNPKDVFERKYRAASDVESKAEREKQLEVLVNRFMDATMNMNGESIAAAHDEAKTLGL